MNSISKKTRQNNEKCYRTEILKFDSGLFDSCIDMAYVLTMEDSKRHDQFMIQLKEHKPSSTVTIQYNKGYRKCNKTHVTSSAYDITDALRNIFVNALENGYKRALVFEDDFFMDKNKYNQSDINSICKFVNKNNPDVYNLGTLYQLALPALSAHQQAMWFNCAHGVLYSKKYMKNFVRDASKGKIRHCDLYWNKFRFSKYSYKYPIVFQLFPKTDNMKEWPMWQIAEKWLKYWKLDKSNEHYTEHFQMFRDIPWMFLLSTLLIIIMIVLICNVSSRNKQ